MTYADGSKWIGEWKNNIQYNGKGTIFRHLRGIRYEGQWENGKLNGKVTITNPDGSKFVGAMKNSKKYGHGTIIYPDGRKKKMPWKNDNLLLK